MTRCASTFGTPRFIMASLRRAASANGATIVVENWFRELRTRMKMSHYRDR